MRTKVIKTFVKWNYEEVVLIVNDLRGIDYVKIVESVISGYPARDKA